MPLSEFSDFDFYQIILEIILGLERLSQMGDFMAQSFLWPEEQGASCKLDIACCLLLHTVPQAFPPILQQQLASVAFLCPVL